MQDWWGFSVSAGTQQDCRSIGHHAGGRDTPGKGRDGDTQALRTRTTLIISVYLLGARRLWAAGSAQELDVGLRPTHTFLQCCEVETSRFCSASAAVTWLVQVSFAQDLPT